MMRRIDLNADLGEGGTEDEALLALVSSCNIACGGHAGSDDIMRRTLAHAVASGVAIGAHPGYEDRENFGRRELELPPQAITDLVARQVEKLASHAREIGTYLHHVKPHGALYNQANREASLAAAVIAGVLEISPGLLLYAPPDGALAAAARTAGMTVRSEGFADRRYQQDGSLQPRSQPGAVIENPDEAVAQALDLATSGRFETLCVHGDGAHAATLLQAIRSALENAGVRIYS
ncbi:MAG: 5-oxoprolinase subunit PxpA [Akkermansiaceae bacterium]